MEVFSKVSSIDKINQLSASRILDPQRSIVQNLSFVPRFMAFLTFPRSKVEGNIYQHSLFFGKKKVTLSVLSHIGIPYGVFPRRFFAFLGKEAVSKKSPLINLGKSQAEFLNILGMQSTGGKRGTISTLKEQVKKILASTISVVSEDEQSWSVENTLIANKATVLWKKTEKIDQWEGELILSQDFFQELIDNPLPIDFNIFKSLQSSFSIDIYCWLKWKTFYIKNDIFLSWEALFKQFGIGYKNNTEGKKGFKKRFISSLESVMKIYELKVRLTKKGMWIIK